MSKKIHTIVIVDNCQTTFNHIPGTIPQIVFESLLDHYISYAETPIIHDDIFVRFMVPRVANSKEPRLKATIERSQKIEKSYEKYTKHNDPDNPNPVHLDVANSYEVILENYPYSSPENTARYVDKIDSLLPNDAMVIMNISLVLPRKPKPDDYIRLVGKTAPEYVLSHALYERLQRRRQLLWLFTHMEYRREDSTGPLTTIAMVENWVKIYEQRNAPCKVPRILGPEILGYPYFDTTLYTKVFNTIHELALPT